MGGGRFEALTTQLRKVLWATLILQLQFQGLSLNLEGLALLDFKSKVEIDLRGALQNWKPQDPDPCKWAGVLCIDGKVETLDLQQLSLGGTLTPELGKLSNLRSIVLCDNKFFGVIPKELGWLTMLELLDLRNNNLVGIIPVEIRNLPLLKNLMISGNKLQSGAESVTQFNKISKLQYDREPLDLRQLGQWFKLKTDYDHGGKHGLSLPSFAKPYIVQNVQHAVSVHRKLLEANNLPAVSIVSTLPQEAVDIPSTGSGSFPAVPHSNGENPPPVSGQLPSLKSAPEVRPLNASAAASKYHNLSLSKSQKSFPYVYVIIAAAVLVSLVCAILFTAWRRQGRSAISPWTTGLSGQLQKAFTAGVRKLNWQELEAACEDFSNIIASYPHYTVFKGTLSSGVEIAVASTIVASANDWSKRSEMRFRKKIDSLCRVNHKNFVNLLGYCEENEPFMRMMVFEYAPNGTLFDHLHVKDYNHLDWGARMRIIMGIAYCLRYMHHELNPPVILSALQSNSILLTEDCAAKIVDLSIWKEVSTKRNLSDEGTNLPDAPAVNARTNIYSFGILLVEIISGKVPYSEEHGNLLNWATDFLNDKRNIRRLVDPALKSFKENELDTLCDIIQECIHPDPKHRPVMADIVDMLREVLSISPEAATPRLSPLWWAELEILSVEAGY